MKTSTSTLIKRVGLAVLGQALPEASALSGTVRAIKLGLIATVITGILAAAFLLLVCFGLYHFLILEGLSVSVSLGFSAAFLLLLLVITGLLAQKHLSNATMVKESLTPFSQTDADNRPEEILSSFLEGLCNTQNMANDKTMSGSHHGQVLNDDQPEFNKY